MKYDNLSLRKTNRSKIMIYQNTTNKKGNSRSKIFPLFFALCSLLIALCTSCEQDPEPEEETSTIFTPPTAPPLPKGEHITISSAADLAKIGKETTHPLNRYYELTENITVSDWLPIGTANTPFRGALDGKNHTITITSGSGGIFSHTSSATIWNLKVAGTITASGDIVQVGGIAGNAIWTHITNCASSVTITATGHFHNSAAGSIVGNMRKNSMINSCTANGSVTLQVGENDESLMIYTGGLVGYAGDGSSDGATPSGCLITKSSYNGTVTATSGYPYTGGIVGYNYSGTYITECFSTGTVTATGANLPYAGGVSGYNSRSAVISDSYSTAAVNATAASKQALAGGIVGSTAAAGSTTARCYATGIVTATIDGNSAADAGGTLAVPLAANAGGISGALYYETPQIENCAALNNKVEAKDTASGGTLNAYRISVRVDGILTNNIANSDMTVTGRTPNDKTAAGQDGADTDAKPAQSVFQTTLNWNFTTVWKMGTNHPILQWQQN
jgi:hypothetical protein